MYPDQPQLLFLELMVTTRFQQRKKLLETLSRIQVRFLSGILHNLLKSNIVLESNHRRRLLKHAALIRKLASKKTPLSVKKQVYSKHYKVVLGIFKPLLPQLKAKFCKDG